MLLAPSVAGAITVSVPPDFDTQHTALTPLQAPNLPLEADYPPEIATTTPDVIVEENKGIEELIRDAFPDHPEMLAIARCESNLRQFDISGAVLMGGMNNHFVGIFQEHVSWETVAQKNGYSIFTTEGNIRMARYLVDNAGIDSQWECAKLI